jgi:peroxiredoxin
MARSALLVCILSVCATHLAAQEEWIKKWIPSYPYYSPNPAATLDSIEHEVHRAENHRVGRLVYKHLYTGRVDSLSSLLGKVVLVNVWGVGCTACIKEFPALRRVQSTFKGRGLIVLTMSREDSAHQCHFFKERNLAIGGITAVVRDEGCSYPFTSIFQPSCYLIDRDGVLKKFWFHAKTYTEFCRIIRPYI